MTTQQGSTALLNDPVAQKLLQSTIPARLAYVWEDGTPRVVPIWFHWDGAHIVVSSPPGAPKLDALRKNPHVAVTIDSDSPPYKVLLIRGKATVEMIPGGVPEYAMAAERYYGKEGAAEWLSTAGKLFNEFGKVSITPEWVGVMDFEQRFPNAIEKAMAGG